ncbi:MAG: hypothetical protein KDD62_10765 [Bdellovibrionales bacterium]|nr:hypothetical protein [Bdellovibrionales bacterium]
MMRFALPFLVLLMLVSPLLGQDGRYNPYRQHKQADGSVLSEKELLERGLKDLGLDPDSPQLRSFLAGRGYGQMRAKTDYKPKVIRHIKGNHGIPFASKEQIDAANKKIIQENMPDVAKFAEQHLAAMVKQKEKAMQTVEPVPLCKTTATHKTQGGELGSDPKGTIISDILILPDDTLAEMDPLELFGRKIQVLMMTPDNKALPSQLAHSLGINCLPGRVRITKEFLYTHYGKDALRNYDKNPNGPGILDERLR